MLSAQDLGLLRKALGRDLTDVELACFENLWSEHCSYRSTRPLLRTLPTAGSEVLLGPGDDAAIVRFSDTCALAIGMESHNHPSYVDPYDGAATGVGGIVRDILSMGARLTLRLKEGTVVITPDEIKTALTATTRRMRY
jgi:phosphoribosylformylglycinamidine synthase